MESCLKCCIGNRGAKIILFILNFSVSISLWSFSKMFFKHRGKILSTGEPALVSNICGREQHMGSEPPCGFDKTDFIYIYHWSTVAYFDTILGEPGCAQFAICGHVR